MINEKIKSLVKLLTQKNLTISTCESLTGGLFATTLTETPGVGQTYKGGFIVYTNEAKQKLVQVSPLTLQKYGAISEQCAKQMAYNAQQLLNTDLAISFTGNAGPASQENKPIGLVYIGLTTKHNLISRVYQFSGSRKEIREQAIEAGIKLIKDSLLN
jgi:PncC family amidohydrolase